MNQTEPAEKPIPRTKFAEWVDEKYGHRPSLATIERWMRRGCNGVTLPSFLIGGLRFIRPSDAIAFFRETNKEA